MGILGGSDWRDDEDDFESGGGLLKCSDDDFGNHYFDDEVKELREQNKKMRDCLEKINRSIEIRDGNLGESRIQNIIQNCLKEIDK
ncbi:MAG: hypothetical protein HWN79_17665 [Candidatus Lokiarchaeota archaeon]|nr:hypothetical protein [Candidatus Lokiarchaeota archaeon]